MNLELDFNTHLVVAGAFDDFAWPDNNTWSSRGAMCIEFSKIIRKINKNKEVIHYIPHINEKEDLYSLYQASDSIISLSTMLNEDYGMAIADAIVLNKRVVCTSWGGYKSFSNFGERISYIDVKLEMGSITFDYESFKQAVLKEKYLHGTPQYSNEFHPDSLIEKFKEQLSTSCSKLNTITKLGRALEGMSPYNIIENNVLQRVYESFWK
jgi:hypothetical protein